MLNKKTIPVAILLLALAVTLVVAGGANQGTSYNVVPGTVVVAGGADQSQTLPPPVPDAPALAPATGDVAFGDTFDNSSLSGWHVLPSSVGLWKVGSKGTLRQNKASADGELSNEDSVLVSDFNSFADGTLEAQVYPTSGELVGVVFRGSDAGYYRLWLALNSGVDSPKAGLQKVIGGRFTDIATNTTWKGYTLATWQTIKVTAVGSHISISIDGTPLLDTNDSSLTNGWVGVWTVAVGGAEFDNVRVQRSVAGR